MRNEMISIRMIAKWSVRDGAFDQKEKYESLFREKEQLHCHSLRVTTSTSFSCSLSLSLYGLEKKLYFHFSPHTLLFPQPSLLTLQTAFACQSECRGNWVWKVENWSNDIGYFVDTIHSSMINSVSKIYQFTNRTEWILCGLSRTVYQSEDSVRSLCTQRRFVPLE